MLIGEEGQSKLWPKFGLSETLSHGEHGLVGQGHGGENLLQVQGQAGACDCARKPILCQNVENTMIHNSLSQLFELKLP